MKSKQMWVFAWAALRLPLLALAVYVFRNPLVELYAGAVGLLGRMDFFVYTVSTFSSRALLAILAMAGIGFGVWAAGKLSLSPAMRYGAILAGSFIAIWLAFLFAFKTDQPALRAAGAILILAINAIPYEWAVKYPVKNRFSNLFFIFFVGVTEALFPQSYMIWLAAHTHHADKVKKWSWLGGVAAASFFWIFLLLPSDNQRVFTLTEKIHADPAVGKISPGVYNWIELNPKHNLLYAVGRGTNFMLAFDLNDPDAPPLRSKTDIGKTQSFGLNPARQEIYVFQDWTQELLYMDALTLEVFKTVPAPELSPGDVWLRWEPITDTIILSSEADAFTGVPLYLFDRESGDILATLPFPVFPTNLTLHPRKPWMYFNSFRDVYFAVWDLETHKIVQQVEIPPRTDRLIFSEEDNEVWIAAPLEGRVLRHDADTLEPVGDIRTRFGDRTLALDSERGLLLTGNFITGKVAVFDLKTGNCVEDYYLGPWIRTIALDSENGIAYVSTIRGLFKLAYAAP